VSTYDIRRAADRFHTRTAWLDSWHGFSFGEHYDPDDTHFGLLTAHNDDRLLADTGFAPHPHRDLEIVTWVLEGSLVHRDSAGHEGVVGPGTAQRVSAGSGIEHSEDAAGVDTHLVQMWVLPDVDGVAPAYEQRDIGAELDRGGRVVVASGMPRYAGERAISIHQRHAALHAARLTAGGRSALPSAPYVHVHVTRGSVDVEDAGTLETADTLRLTDGDGQRITALTDDAEVLVWEMHAGPWWSGARVR
jgi:redox-sensitive bicupin YhaK (pirin superfamily)